jgi:hypothetical protein
MVEFLSSYEEVNLTTYMDYRHDNLIMANPDKAQLKENIMSLSEKLRNPY